MVPHHEDHAGPDRGQAPHGRDKRGVVGEDPLELEQRLCLVWRQASDALHVRGVEVHARRGEVGDGIEVEDVPVEDDLERALDLRARIVQHGSELVVVDQVALLVASPQRPLRVQRLHRGQVQVGEHERGRPRGGHAAA